MSFWKLFKRLKERFTFKPEPNEECVYANVCSVCGAKLVYYGPAPVHFLRDEYGSPISVSPTYDVNCPVCKSMVALKPFPNEELAEAYMNERLLLVAARATKREKKRLKRVG